MHPKKVPEFALSAAMDVPKRMVSADEYNDTNAATAGINFNQRGDLIVCTK